MSSPYIYECRECGEGHSKPLSALSDCSECGNDTFIVVVHASALRRC